MLRPPVNISRAIRFHWRHNFTKTTLTNTFVRARTAELYVSFFNIFNYQLIFKTFCLNTSLRVLKYCQSQFSDNYWKAWFGYQRKHFTSFSLSRVSLRKAHYSWKLIDWQRSLEKTPTEHSTHFSKIMSKVKIDKVTEYIHDFHISQSLYLSIVLPLLLFKVPLNSRFLSLSFQTSSTISLFQT